MRSYFTISVLTLLITFKMYSQNEFKHLIGIAPSFFTGPSYAGKVGGMDATYMFSHSNLFLKFETGIYPFTNYGMGIKVIPLFGYTTKLKYPISWHLGIGFSYVTFNGSRGNYELLGFGRTANSGFLFHLPKKENIKLGIDACISMYQTSSNSSAPMSNHTNYGYIMYMNLSFYYAIGKKKSSEMKNSSIQKAGG